MQTELVGEVLQWLIAIFVLPLVLVMLIGPVLFGILYLVIVAVYRIVKPVYCFLIRIRDTFIGMFDINS